MSFGVYVHWPFCAAKCPYCDFNSHVSAHVNHSKWADAYGIEISRHAALCPEEVVTSIYFGGGTPSLMEPETVARVIETIRAAWRCANDLEITLEANPGSVESARFAAFRAAGVNRVSVGVQALNDPDLRALGRIHTAAEALAALEIARATFDRVSFDLIYARQGQSLDAWRTELTAALASEPDHLSLYQLTIEPGTMFHRRYEAGRLPGLPSDDLSADMFETTQNICADAGLPAYEVSNHARPGHESRHNLIYWTGAPYAGIGPGAHGRLLIADGWIATEGMTMPAKWLNTVHADKPLDSVPITPKDRVNEQLMMGLRLRQGISLSTFGAHRAEIAARADAADPALVQLKGDMIRATDRGRAVLNHLLIDLLL